MTRNEKDNNPDEARYEGVRDLYQGVHEEYSGVHEEWIGVDTDVNIEKTLGQAVEDEPTVAPGMRDFLEKDAAPKEVKEGDFTRVTTLSFDETH